MGQIPPYALKWLVLAGCQSRVLKTGSPRSRNSFINLLSGATTSSPCATASDPPGQKSFWTSTTIKALFFSFAIILILRVNLPGKRCNEGEIRSAGLRCSPCSLCLGGEFTPRNRLTTEAQGTLRKASLKIRTPPEILLTLVGFVG